jgi:uncharacterized protein (DUF1810 family)
MGLALERFLAAQEGVYAQALAEVKAGRKESHWMWFVFPQMAGLGRSGTARFFGIASAAEARAYLAHSVLGPRLRGAAEALLTHKAGSAEAIFGVVDAMKLKSSMTLFAAVAEDPAPFAAVLDAFFAGARDPTTLGLIDG